MNLHTFKDVVTSKRSSLANDIDEDEDEVDVAALADDIDGEEDDGHEKFNEIGEVIEPFNLKNEREQGHFDTNMNFVWRKERAEPDAWLANMDEAAMEKSIGEAAAALKMKRQKEEDSVGPENRSDKSLKIELLGLLRSGETVISAMHRLSGKKSRTAGKSAVKKRLPIKASATSADPQTSEQLTSNSSQGSSPAIPDKVSINRLTELADQLISSGLTGLYDMKYESIESSMYMWEYKGQDGCVHGPYTCKQISDWRKGGYFTGANAVLMRRVSDAPEPENVTSRTSHEMNADVKSTNEVRKTLRPDGQVQEPSSKRRKVADEASNQDLLDDLENDEDGDDNDDNDIEVFRHVKGQSLGGGSRQEQLVKYGPWFLSDDIDFGDYVDLPDDQPSGNNAEADDDDDDYS